MPCVNPLQATYRLRSDGKKDVSFSTERARRFYAGEKLDSDGSYLSLPCGKCMPCRLERSRQWAVRIMHEAQLYRDNCFLTLTFDDNHLAKMCPNGSLDRRHMQLFMKRLRDCRDDNILSSDPSVGIRVFYCGEYGEKSQRPHYHLCLFNCDFGDRQYLKMVNGYRYDTSAAVRRLWPYGNNILGDLSFESAAYVARYCTKKVTGSAAKDHYGDRLPEFGQASLKPGIGKRWLDKYGESDVFSFDEVVVRGSKCKPPRYYDKYLQCKDPARFEQIKLEREQCGKDREDDNTYARLKVKEKCLAAKTKSLIRRLESSDG